MTHKKSGSRTLGILGPFFILMVLLSSGATLAGPLSERVIFVAKRSGLDKLYICRPDGRDLQRFVKQTGNQIEPCYSPALKRVFYVRTLDKRAEICSVDHQGRDFRVDVSLKANANQPTVSPDGQHLVFTTDLWGATELAQLDFHSGEIQRLTYDQSINTHPRYSPDGKSVAFLSRRTGQSELFLLSLEGHGFTCLTDTAFHKGAPAWKPDGTRIVSTETIPPKFKSVLFELDLQDKKRRYLLPKTRDVSLPVYSVDGSQILFLEEQALQTFDPSDTTALPFPVKGELYPSSAIWVKFPLP